jgi:hypothetical protein
VSTDPERGGPTQQRVRATIEQVGGYWRPLAGVVRLLEELGELAESSSRASSRPGELASELADLWIITTALADQFLAEVAEPGSQPEPENEQCSLGRILAAAAQIARIVNYYDGPKTPRSLQELPSLGVTVEWFHRLLAGSAQASGVDLAAAVVEKLAAIALRDAGRFRRSVHDPSTASCLDEFRSIETDTLGCDREGARLWGSPACPASLELAVYEILPTLSCFARAARRERLDAYVIAAPEKSAVEVPPAWVGQLLGALADRVQSGCGIDGAAAAASERFFDFEGLAMTVAILSPPYDTLDERPTPETTFLVLRPAEGVRAHLPGA